MTWEEAPAPLSTQDRSGEKGAPRGQIWSLVTSGVRAAGGAVGEQGPTGAGLDRVGHVGLTDCPPMGPVSSSHKRQSLCPASGTLKGSSGAASGQPPARVCGLHAGCRVERAAPVRLLPTPSPEGSEGLICGLCGLLRCPKGLWPNSLAAPLVSHSSLRPNVTGWGLGRVCPQSERAQPQQQRRASQEGRPRGGASAGGPDWRRPCVWVCFAGAGGRAALPPGNLSPGALAQSA